MAYEYDVFISYRRANPVRDWVHKQFHPRLQEWLGESTKHEPRIFLDEAIEAGDTWPQSLRNAIAGSRLLVPVLSAPYFRSSWCVAEFNTMRERERMAGYRCPENPGGLIIPVIFHGPELLPQNVREMKPADFTAWAYSHPYFANKKQHIGFIQAVKELALILAAELEGTPEWQPGWPIALPEPTPLQNVPLPRFG